VERTRFRETTRTFRQKSGCKPRPPPMPNRGTKKNVSATVQKPGKKEKIRYGQAPTKTLPSAAVNRYRRCGRGSAGWRRSAIPAPEPNRWRPATSPRRKHASALAPSEEKKTKAKGPQLDSDAPPPPDAAEVADRQEQAASLGLNGDTSTKKKKKNRPPQARRPA
jgi:peptidyl-prolyl cis-trans isomerase SurA